jgi:TolB-like protein/Tfp pilus assembly protein PilF
MKGLLREMRRRNVWRAMLLYLGATWALAQGISELAPAIGLPDWAPRAFLIAAALGFPFWVAFAWLYEFTPEGFKRERDVPEGESIARQTGRKLDYWIIAVLALAVVLLLTDRLMPGHDAAVEAGPDDPRSIAVLPLSNAGGDDDGYFADGLTEEMISRLSRIDGLRVIARTSAFEFKDSRLPRREIAERLGVAHLLEGTVRRHGDQLRIVVDLVRPDDGTSLWSESYNRRLQDVFAVQADIAQAVARALELQLGTRDRVDHERPPNGNMAAYEALLRGRAKYQALIIDDFPEAARLYREAIRLEPDYAMAYAELAGVLANLARFRSGAERQSTVDELRDVAHRVMALAPDFHGSHLAQGFVHAALGEHERALAAYRRALDLAPNDPRTLHNVAMKLGELGREEEAIPLSRRAVELDPLNVNLRVTLADLYQWNGQRDMAGETLREALGIAPDHPNALVGLGWLYYTTGQYDLAESHIRRALEVDPGREAWKTFLAHAVVGARGLEAGWRVLEEALAAQPGHPAILATMAELQLAHGNTAAALEYARRGLDADPNQSTAAIMLASALSMLGHLDEAEQVARNFLARRPAAMGLHAALAEVAALRGDADAALAAAEAEPEADSRRYALALAAATAGERAATDRALATMREECNGYDLCLANIAAVHACLGDTARLHATLEEAETTRSYRPFLGFPCLDRYYDDPRFIAHLAKYGMTPPARLSPPRRAH